jgi:hypothetical protein
VWKYFRLGGGYHVREWVKFYSPTFKCDLIGRIMPPLALLVSPDEFPYGAGKLHTIKLTRASASKCGGVGIVIVQESLIECKYLWPGDLKFEGHNYGLGASATMDH